MTITASKHACVTALNSTSYYLMKHACMQVIQTPFPGTKLVDLCPLELIFGFVPNKRMRCHLSLTNNTDTAICCVIKPKAPSRYWCNFEEYLVPMFTAAITLHRDADEELPSDTDKFEIVVLITGCDDEDIFRHQISMLSLDENTPFEGIMRAAHESLGFQLHRAMLTAVFVVSEEDEDDDRAVSMPCMLK